MNFLITLVCMASCMIVSAMDRDIRLPPDYKRTLTSIFKENRKLSQIAQALSVLSEQNFAWKRRLSDMHCAGYLIKHMSELPGGYKQKEIIAIVLNTPGTLAWCKVHARNNLVMQRNLNLFMAQRCRSDDPNLIAYITRILDLEILPPKREILPEAAGNGNTALVEMLLNRGTDIESRDEEGETALYRAVAKGDKPLIDLLITRGANVNAMTNLGEDTPLHRAAENYDMEIVRKLIAAGADLKNENQLHETPASILEKKANKI